MPSGELLAGRFQLDTIVRVGGMGAVWRAIDTATGSPAAVKLLAGAGDALEARFEREAELLAALDHPGIVRHLAHGRTTDGRLYLAMEWLDGEDLARRLQRGRLPAAEALAVVRGAARALAPLHARGGVHRDVKPGNLFLVDGRVDQVKLLDFGIARLALAARLTASGELAGTPGYTAPEQARGERRVDARADVFALGCVLYECLTGRPAFAGEHVMAVLAKILLADPTRPSELAADVPPAFEALLARVLDKEPERRPADAATLLGELDAIADRAPLTPGAGRPTPRPPTLGSAEQRFMCLILIADARHGTPEAARLGELDTAPGVAAVPALEQTLTPAPGAGHEQALALARAHGGRLEVLADGSWVVTPTPALLRTAATDQAAQVCRLALALARQLPGARLAVAAGRGVQAGRVPVGEVIDRAATLLAARAGGVRIDALTADLVSGRFDIVVDGGAAARLGGERADAAPERQLLGRATPCVGRDRELATLVGLAEECAAEPVARAVLVVAPAGYGKSRVAAEVRRQLDARGLRFRALASRGDAMQAGAPYAVAARLVRRAAGIVLGMLVEEQQRRLGALVAHVVAPAARARVTTFLGQLADVPVPEPVAELEAARRDPLVMGEQIRRAFEDWLAAECAAAPVLLVIDDVHLGDGATIKLLDGALRRLRDQPLYLCALGRPEVDDAFPSLWSERDLQRVPLRELPRRACQRLVREVLRDADDATVERLVAQSAGNAFYLEELIRVVAEGRAETWPGTVLAMAQARLEGLDADARRLLRAAAVFGDRFPRAGAAALWGDPAEAARVDAFLDALVESEMLVAAPDAPDGGAQLAFRHPLVREAAYALLTDADRALGHRLAAEWLESAGERDAALLAEHWQRGGMPERAAQAYLGAARVALRANDLDAVLRWVERGIAAGARGEDLGELLWMRAEAHRWRADFTASAETSALALAALTPGGAVWCDAVGTAISSYASVQQYDRLVDLIGRLRDAPRRPGASIVRVCALARAAVQLFLVGRYALADEIIEAAEREAGPPESRALLVEGRLLDARAFRAGARSEQGVCLDLLTRAADAYHRAGDLRHACMTESNLGYTWLQIGAYERAVEVLERAFADAERLGLGFVAGVAQQNLGLALAHAGERARAERIERDSVAGLRKRQDMHMASISRIYLAQILALGGRLDEAEEEVALTLEPLADSPPGLALALATQASLRLQRGQAAAALGPARQAHALLEQLGGLDEGEMLVRATFARALVATGRGDEARAVVAVARARLDELAGKLADRALRAQFLGRVPEHSAILALAESCAPNR